jgi:hypothetical protein
VNFYAPADVSLPAAVTVFPDEYVTAPRSWTEKAYHNLIFRAQISPVSVPKLAGDQRAGPVNWLALL